MGSGSIGGSIDKGVARLEAIILAGVGIVVAFYLSGVQDVLVSWGGQILSAMGRGDLSFLWTVFWAALGLISFGLLVSYAWSRYRGE